MATEGAGRGGEEGLERSLHEILYHSMTGHILHNMHSTVLNVQTFSVDMKSFSENLTREVAQCAWQDKEESVHNKSKLIDLL